MGLFQMQREGVVRSAIHLRMLFEELDFWLGTENLPPRIAADLERNFDDLAYYVNRCLVWLSDLANSIGIDQIVQ